jgi:hypothetical protein
MSLKTHLEQVRKDAERIQLQRIRRAAEENGTPVPPRAAHGDTVLPKEKPVEVAVESKDETVKKKGTK